MKSNKSNDVSKQGVVVFFDLMGFSTNEDPKQRKMAQGLMNSISYRIIKLYGVMPQKVDNSPVIILPTGDGAAVIFFDKAANHSQIEKTALWFAGSILLWANSHDPSIGIRCGINSGMLDFIADPYGEMNVCGTSINTASRIMDSALPGQILASVDTFVSRVSLEDESDIKARVSDETHEILVKHNELLRVKNIVGELLDGDTWSEFGRDAVPQNKWHLQADPPTLTLDEWGNLSKKVPPVELLKKHLRISFVGLNHDSLMKS